MFYTQDQDKKNKQMRLKNLEVQMSSRVTLLFNFNILVWCYIVRTVSMSRHGYRRTVDMLNQLVHRFTLSNVRLDPKLVQGYLNFASSYFIHDVKDIVWDCY